jgi:CRP-like cAMP-binding protein
VAERRLRLVSQTWRVLSRLLVDRCRLLTEDVDVRLLRALGTLGRDFGHDHDGGTLIALDITHRDIAELVAAGPSTVRHALARLLRAGRIDRVGRHLLVRRAPGEEDAS